jgi:inhibitor of KinA sporulation pathway (predicted exonuclease)
VGLDLVGTHHRGIDDARNIARLLPYCLGWREAPRFSARPE